jgi:hypothetical protein
MRRQGCMQPGGGSGYVLPVGISVADERAGCLGRTPPSLIGTGWIAGNAQATVTPAAETETRSKART